jgi:hypothetical protein
LAETDTGADSAPSLRKFAMRDLWRIALWGLAASVALAAAGYATATATGHDRIGQAMAQLREIIRPSGIKPPQPLGAEEGRQLAEAVRLLTADRDRLQSRLSRLERGIDDLSTALVRVEHTMAQPAAKAMPEPAASTPDEVTSSINPPAPSGGQAPQPAASGSAPRTEFGVDLGAANSLDGLRTLWANSRQRHGSLLEGLRPIVQMRERPRPAAAELRLVAGPLVNATAAAKLCAAMTAAGAVCHPSLFDGQRLATR